MMILCVFLHQTLDSPHQRALPEFLYQASAEAYDYVPKIWFGFIWHKDSSGLTPLATSTPIIIFLVMLKFSIYLFIQRKIFCEGETKNLLELFL
jgi:hypothetical protein